MNISSKIIFGSWPHGGNTCYLVLKSKQQFRAVDGEIVLPGPYRIVPCVVSGRNITIPLIAGIPTTTDSSNPDATWDAYFEDSTHSRKMDWLLGFQLSHVFNSPVLWELIFDDNNPQGIPVPSGGISYDQAVLLFQRLLDTVTTPILASGVGTLAADGEPVTILSALVAADSPIELIPKSDTITGDLRVSNRVAGVSFDVTSSNGADSGDFLWRIYP